MYNTLLGILSEDVELFNAALLSDEANFRVLGFVNKSYMGYWVTANPREPHEQALHSPKVTVWCAVATFWIAGAFLFEALSGCR